MRTAPLVLLLFFATTLGASAQPLPPDSISGGLRIVAANGFQCVLFGYNSLRYHPTTGVDYELPIWLSRKKAIFYCRLRHSFGKGAFQPAAGITIRKDGRAVSVYAERSFDDWKRDSVTTVRWPKATFNAFFLHRNLKSVTDRRLVRLRFAKPFADNAAVSAQVEHYRHKMARNITSFSVFKRHRRFDGNNPITPENPDSAIIAGVRHATALQAGVRLGDLIKTDRELSLRIRAFSQGGFGDWGQWNGSAQVRLCCFWLWDDNDKHLYAACEAGGVLKPSKAKFYEWNHALAYYTTNTVYTEPYGVEGFVNLKPYALSTPGAYADADIRLKYKGLMLTRINWMRGTTAYEELYVKARYMFRHDLCYTQAGYVLGDLLRCVRLGVFATFRGADFCEATFRMSLNMRGLMVDKTPFGPYKVMLANIIH